MDQTHKDRAVSLVSYDCSQGAIAPRKRKVMWLSHRRDTSGQTVAMIDSDKCSGHRVLVTARLTLGRADSFAAHSYIRTPSLPFFKQRLQSPLTGSAQKDKHAAFVPLTLTQVFDEAKGRPSLYCTLEGCRY